MSITRELRGYATNWHGFFYDNKDGCLIQAVGHQPPDSTPVTEIFREIADRIDERYRIDVLAANLAGKSNAMQEAVERVESTHVKLPVDADGVPIHIGDRVEWSNGSFTVHELKLTEDGWQTWDSEHGYTVHADECIRHVQPDSWERIIQDAIAEGFERTDASAPCVVGNDELVERCKKLAGEAE